jgi:hypothetical protein
MNIGDVLRVTAGLAVRIYSFVRLDQVLKAVNVELLGNHGIILQWTVLNVSRALIAQKLVSRAPPNAALQRVAAAAGLQPQGQQRQRQQGPVRGIPPLPARK